MANAVKVTAHILYSAAFFIFLTIPIRAEVFGIGSCPAVRPSGNTVLKGVWYEQRRFDSAFQRNLRCIRYQFGAITGGTASLDITGKYYLTGRNYELHGKITPYPPNSLNIYSVDFSSTILYSQNFIVLGISPGAWVTLYSCTSYGIFNVQQVILLTATRTPTKAIIDAALATITSNNLPRWLLTEVDQTLC